MIIQNYEIIDFGNFLMELKLKGRVSNMRVRLVKLLNERVALIAEERDALFSDYVSRDEDGNPVKEINEDTGEVIYPVENGDEYREELDKLMTEDFIIEESGAHKLMFDMVREAIYECNLELSGQDALQYDRWCEIMEGVAE